MQEIENCPDCYMNAHTKKDTWFVAACRIPHLLVWAKLKGFPFWPGKAMRINSDENVDVRFFGAHDRAWIPIKDVFLYSQEPPVVVKVSFVMLIGCELILPFRKKYFPCIYTLLQSIFTEQVKERQLGRYITRSGPLYQTH